MQTSLQAGEVLSVSQLTLSIKKKIEGDFPFVYVQGEVSNLRKQASGHIYFTLKDHKAQISCALFRTSALRQKQLPKEGDQVTVHGELSVYLPRGSYQILVRDVEFTGVGALLRQLHKRKMELESAGYFDRERKRPLPHLPKKIGVITSPTGSVIQDILNVLRRRFSGFHLILNPVRVQGAEAAGEIAKAIKECNEYRVAEVLIVCRGGGSLEDLWPFNETIVCEAIYQSEIPIISAVGHETDFTLVDFVADVRAPTPSAAAEIATAEKGHLLTQLTQTKRQILQSLQSRLRSYQKTFQTLLKYPILCSPYPILSPFLQKIDGIEEKLGREATHYLSEAKLRLKGFYQSAEALKPSVQISNFRRRFAEKQQELGRTISRHIIGRGQKLLQLKDYLHAIDPRNLLQRGYSIVFSEKKDSVILSVKEAKCGERLKIQLSDGNLIVKVETKS